MLKRWWARITGQDPDPPALADADAAPSVVAPTAADIHAALGRVRAMALAGHVPDAVLSRLRQIEKLIRDTLPRLSNLAMTSRDAYSVMATATDYLPEAIAGYLRLPRDWADSRPIEQGKTSLMLLIDQLDLLAATMDRIYDAVNRHDAQALIANGRFLQAKFGKFTNHGGPGDLGAVPPAALEPPPEPRSSLDL